MEIEFKSFSEIEPASSVSGMIYGPAGSGKTDFAGSCGERSLYIDVGRSSETFHGASFKQRRGAYKGIYVPITEAGSKTNYIMPDKAEAYDMVCDVIDEALLKIFDQFDVVILDELSAFGRFAMNKGLEINQGTGKSKANEASKKWDMILPGKQDFGTEMGLVKNFLAGTIDLLKKNGKHFLVIAHERYLYQSVTNKDGVKVETDVISKILPSFTGKKDIDAIPNMFDLVWHTETVRNGENYIYRMRTQGDDILVAKTRYGGIFKSIETDLDFPKVIERIKAGVGVKK